MEKLELALINQIKPGIPYQELHNATLTGIANLLIEHQLCNQAVSTLLQQKIPQLFMPHGVGHLLGIQVHDVGGWQKDIAGTSLPPAEHSPALRNTRCMEKNMVFTIEPGFYFIPLLLEPERSQARGKFINWELVDSLYPCGGIRVEDNVRVTEDGVENLTRR
jgi:Xaa-Pro dipeptidase